jgi:hypothetical protein
VEHRGPAPRGIYAINPFRLPPHLVGGALATTSPSSTRLDRVGRFCRAGAPARPARDRLDRLRIELPLDLGGVAPEEPSAAGRARPPRRAAGRTRPPPRARAVAPGLTSAADRGRGSWTQMPARRRRAAHVEPARGEEALLHEPAIPGAAPPEGLGSVSSSARPAGASEPTRFFPSGRCPSCPDRGVDLADERRRDETQGTLE